MASVAIVGGGISGLSAAYYLAKNSSPSLIRKIIVLEGSPQLGGWMRSHRHDDGCLFEVGPRSIRSAGRVGQNTLELVEELGLSDEVLGVPASHPASTRRYIYAKGSVHMLPSKLTSMFRRRDPFSKSLIRHLSREPFVRRSELPDESIHDFVSRRISPEFAKYLLSAVCRGIYAGSTRQLSVKSCFPALFDYEKHYGSVAMGMLRAPKEKLESSSELVRKFRSSRWSVWSLKRGLQQLIEQLQRELEDTHGVEITTSQPCQEITFNNGKAQVTTSTHCYEVDYVVNTCYAATVSDQISSQFPRLSELLSRIPAVTVGVVSMEIPGHDLTPVGFGHLVPVGEPSKVLGVIYDSHVFEEHNNKQADSTRLTCMMGGAWFEEQFGSAAHVSGEDLIPAALEALYEQLGIKHDPTRVIANVHKDCIPQYVVGHSALLADIEASLRRHAVPLSLIGSSYRGVSVNDCIHNAKLEASSIITKLEAAR